MVSPRKWIESEDGMGGSIGSEGVGKGMSKGKFGYGLRFCLLSILVMFFSSCSSGKKETGLKFATSADYPPFEYQEKGQLCGFDIELARMVAAELGREAEFHDMSFGNILLALENGRVDGAVSAIAVTPEREKVVDFSQRYYYDELALVTPRRHPLTSLEELEGKIVACQLGTTMEIWLKAHVPQATILSMDHNLQAIEALRSGRANGVLVDLAQGRALNRQYPELVFCALAQSDEGYAMAFRKGSPLTDQVNHALEVLKRSGKIARLKAKYQL